MRTLPRNERNKQNERTCLQPLRAVEEHETIVPGETQIQWKHVFNNLRSCHFSFLKPFIRDFIAALIPSTN